MGSDLLKLETEQTKMKTKHCGGCDQTKPLTEFANNKLAKDGRQYHCRTCLNAYSVVRKAAIKNGSWNQ